MIAARKGSLRRFPDKVYFEFADQLFGTEVCRAYRSTLGINLS